MITTGKTVGVKLSETAASVASVQYENFDHALFEIDEDG